MCLILFANDYHERYKLILAANRDEFYERPSLKADYWPESPEILAGRDLEAGGTWLGITRQGRLAALTNYRDPLAENKMGISRGMLVSGYLKGIDTAEEYLAKVQRERHSYKPFNLLVGNQDQLYYYSPLKNRVSLIEPGVHGLSNSFLETPWPKVSKGKRLLSEIISKQDFSPKDLLELLLDQELFEDHRLPDTGVGIEMERLLSSIYLKSPKYGTRARTVLLIDRQNHVSFIELSYNENKQDFTQVCYEFDIATAN